MHHTKSSIPPGHQYCTIDGDPVSKDSEVDGLQFVANSPFFIAKEIKAVVYYIKGGDH